MRIPGDNPFRTALDALSAPGTASEEELRETFLQACAELDASPAEKQRISDIADLLDAEEDLYQQALAAVDRGERDTAIPLLRRCAEAGTGESAWLLAQLLEDAGDTQEVMTWYQRARDEGDPRASGEPADCPILPVLLGPQDLVRALRRAPDVTFPPAPGAGGPDAAAPVGEIQAEADTPGSGLLWTPGSGLTAEETQRRIMDRWDSFFPEDSVVIFFAGHGYNRPGTPNYTTWLTDTITSRQKVFPKDIPGFPRNERVVLWDPNVSPQPKQGVVVLDVCLSAGDGTPARWNSWKQTVLDLRRRPGIWCVVDRHEPWQQEGEPVVADVLLPPSEVPECGPYTPVGEALKRLLESGPWPCRSARRRGSLAS